MSAGDPHQAGNNITYQAAAAANVVISATPAFLHAIIVGKYVTNGIIEVSNHASDGDGNIVLHLESTLRAHPINAFFDVGICVDMTLQTDVSFIWR